MQKIIRTSTVPLSLNLFCRGLLHELSSEYEVVALSSPRPELDEIARREKIRTIAVEMRRQISPWHDLVSLYKLIRVFRREHPHMVHSITPKAGLLSMLAAWIARVPIRVHTFTGLVFPTASGLKRWLLMQTDRLTCYCSTHIIAEGEGVRNDLLQYGITKKPIQILGYGNIRGIDLAYYDRTDEVMQKTAEIKKSLNVTDNTFTFVFVGRLVHEKGIDELVETFCRILAEGYDIRLLLVGDEEPADPVSARSQKSIAATPEIIFTDSWLEDVRSYYAAADALVFPSYREGFPNVVIEAGAMQLASIVTDINGSREIIRNGENGIIIPARDKEALYIAMKDMITNRERTKTMSAKARPLIASRYEQGFVRSKLKEFYRNTLK